MSQGTTGSALDAALDLVTGSTCVGCDAPGRPWCRACREALTAVPWCCWPDATPAGLVPPWAATPYAGAVRAMVLAHKEHRVLPLSAPLGGLLATAVEAALSGRDPRTPVVLVPVPSRGAGVRARGHDATARMTRAAAVALRGTATVGSTAPAVVAAPLLRLRPGVVDQSGLDAAARVANLATSMACDAARLRRLARRVGRAHVVVCDDVVTTGATAREAQRALEASGVRVTALACVAATVLRRKGPSGLSSSPVKD